MKKNQLPIAIASVCLILLVIYNPWVLGGILLVGLALAINFFIFANKVSNSAFERIGETDPMKKISLSPETGSIMPFYDTNSIKAWGLNTPGLELYRTRDGSMWQIAPNTKNKLLDLEGALKHKILDAEKYENKTGKKDWVIAKYLQSDINKRLSESSWFQGNRINNILTGQKPLFKKGIRTGRIAGSSGDKGISWELCPLGADNKPVETTYVSQFEIISKYQLTLKNQEIFRGHVINLVFNVTFRTTDPQRAFGRTPSNPLVVYDEAVRYIIETLNDYLYPRLRLEDLDDKKIDMILKEDGVDTNASTVKDPKHKVELKELLQYIFVENLFQPKENRGKVQYYVIRDTEPKEGINTTINNNGREKFEVKPGDAVVKLIAEKSLSKILHTELGQSIENFQYDSYEPVATETIELLQERRKLGAMRVRKENEFVQQELDNKIIKEKYKTLEKRTHEYMALENNPAAVDLMMRDKLENFKGTTYVEAGRSGKKSSALSNEALLALIKAEQEKDKDENE